MFHLNVIGYASLVVLIVMAVWAVRVGKNH